MSSNAHSNHCLLILAAAAIFSVHDIKPGWLEACLCYSSVLLLERSMDTVPSTPCIKCFRGEAGCRSNRTHLCTQIDPVGKSHVGYLSHEDFGHDFFTKAGCFTQRHLLRLQPPHSCPGCYKNRTFYPTLLASMHFTFPRLFAIF